MLVQTIVHCCLVHQQLIRWTNSSLDHHQVSRADSSPHHEWVARNECLVDSCSQLLLPGTSFASGGAFNASPDIIDSWAAFTCEHVVLLVSPENAILIGVQSIIS